MASMVGNTGGTSAEVNRPQARPGLIGGAETRARAEGGRLAGGIRQQAVEKAVANNRLAKEKVAATIR